MDNIISYSFDGIEHDEFDLTVDSIPDSVLEGRTSTVYTFFYCTIVP